MKDKYTLLLFKVQSYLYFVFLFQAARNCFITFRDIYCEFENIVVRITTPTQPPQPHPHPNII